MQAQIKDKALQHELKTAHIEIQIKSPAQLIPLTIMKSPAPVLKTLTFAIFYHYLSDLSSRRSTSRNPKMPFKRYVEIGRIALVNYGKDYGKLVVIVDVIDQNRALVDAPDMVRGQMNFKRLTLTDIKIDIKRVPNKKTLIAALDAADVKNKWESSSWGRKLIVQKKRASLNDFDRFKIMLAKIKKAGVVKQELAKLKKETSA
ncbi:hypothetical protein SSX86_026782 [Deinandra increscens subsp. villosa]|uniref:Large ribosomal subunit protein eL14 domain-containing protein n=1 Tax=Deinandra increscens subsp. villosa TaxID=3103831 RepID=A0AAP0CK90_9ASTR